MNAAASCPGRRVVIPKSTPADNALTAIATLYRRASRSIMVTGLNPATSDNTARVIGGCSAVVNPAARIGTLDNGVARNPANGHRATRKIPKLSPTRIGVRNPHDTKNVRQDVGAVTVEVNWTVAGNQCVKRNDAAVRTTTGASSSVVPGESLVIGLTKGVTVSMTASMVNRILAAKRTAGKCLADMDPNLTDPNLTTTLTDPESPTIARVSNPNHVPTAALSLAAKCEAARTNGRITRNGSRNIKAVTAAARQTARSKA